jgi:hypothetical protein
VGPPVRGGPGGGGSGLRGAPRPKRDLTPTIRVKAGEDEQGPAPQEKGAGCRWAAPDPMFRLSLGRMPKRGARVV